MPFTGIPTVTRVGNNVVRIAGIKIPGESSGTISLYEGSGEIKMPDACNWSPYAGGDESDHLVTLDESVSVSWVFVEAIPDTDLSSRIWVSKTDGDDPTTFLITLTNDGDQGEGNESPEMEIWIRFHD